MTQLSSLRSRTRSELKIDPNGRVWSDAILNQNINEAVTQIETDGDYNWEFNDNSYSVTTVDGTADYALPSDFVRIEYGAIKWDGGELNPRDYRELFRYNDMTQEGTVSWYYLRGSNIGLYPIPNQAKTLTFLYRSQLDSMVNDSDDSGMPSNFDEAICAYAEFLCWMDVNDREQQDRAMEKYRLALEGLNSQYLGRRDEANFEFTFESING